MYKILDFIPSFIYGKSCEFEYIFENSNLSNFTREKLIYGPIKTFWTIFCHQILFLKKNVKVVQFKKILTKTLRELHRILVRIMKQLNIYKKNVTRRRIARE